MFEFLFIVVIVISILLNPRFDKFQSMFNHWWKLYSDQTRIKSLLKRLKNIGMAFEKLYRNNLKAWISRAEFQDRWALASVYFIPRKGNWSSFIAESQVNFCVRFVTFNLSGICHNCKFYKGYTSFSLDWFDRPDRRSAQDWIVMKCTLNSITLPVLFMYGSLFCLLSEVPKLYWLIIKGIKLPLETL